MTTILLYEDNAGGLHMTDGETVVSGFERTDSPDPNLVKDMTSWDDWKDDATEKAPFDSREFYGLRIAEYDGNILTMYFASMGIAGKRYANYIEV